MTRSGRSPTTEAGKAKDTTETPRATRSISRRTKDTAKTATEKVAEQSNATDVPSPVGRTTRSRAKQAAETASSHPFPSPSKQPSLVDTPARPKRKRRSAEQLLVEEALQSDLAEQAALSNEEADLPRKRRRTRSSMEGTKDNNSENGASPQLRAVGATSSKRGKGSRSRSKPGASPQLAPTAYVDDDEGPTSPNPSGGRSRTSSRRASKTRQADPDGTGLEDFAMEQPQSPSLGGRRKKKQEQPAPNPTEDGHEDGAAKSPAGSTRSKKKEAAGSSSAEKQKGKSSPVGNDQGSSSASSPAPGAGGQVPGTLPGAGAASLASFFGLTGVRSVPGAPGGSSSATSGRFASLLAQLRSKDDPTAQMIALQELSEILSVATEDMFSSRLGGYGGSSMSGFDVEAWVRELLNVVKGPEKKDPKEALRAAGFADDFPLEFLDAETLAELGISTGDSGGGSIAPDLMLLALRCLSNLLEALPSTTAIIMHCGGVPVLVGKMKEIEYIDLAESVLSVLQKVATEYPVHVLRADGLNAVLGYIDFFALSTQRVAVNIAAAALRGLGSVSGAEEMVRTAMPTLERLVGYGDARLVEGVVKALNRVVDWATRPQAQSTPEAGKSQTAEERVESMITPSMLRAILDLLSPNAANTSVVTPQLFTQLLRLLPPVMRTSSKYAHLMVAQWGLVDLVRGVLCGPEPIETADAFGGGEDAEDSAASGLAERVMKMISSRTEEQLIEALNVASDALVGLPKDDMWALKVKMTRPVAVPSPANPKQAADEDVAMDAVHKGANNDGEAAEGKAQEGDEGQAGDSGAVYGEGDEEEDEEGFEDEDDEEEHVVQSTSNTSSVLAERNAKLVDLYKQDKDSLLEFCGALLPVILEVHAATVQMQIRRRCTALIARMLWLGSEIAGEEALRKILGRAKGFGGFVTALIVQGRDGAYAAYPVEAQQGGVGPSATAVAAAGEANKRADQLAVLAAGLQLALLVLARCSDPYLRAFVREGVLHEVEKTAQMATFWLEAQQAPSMEGGAGQDVVMTEAGTQDSKSASGPTRRSSRRLRAKDSVGSSSTAPDSSLAANPLQPSSTTDLLDGMRRMLALLADTMEDRLGQGTRPGADGTSLTSATASGSKSRSASSVLSLGGDRFADKDVREWAVWMCSRILSFYSEKAQTSGTSEVVSVLGEMKALAKKLLVAGKEESNAVGDPAHIRLLHRVAELLAGVGLGEEGKGATTFEVLQSGIAEGLAAFLDANPTSCGGQSSGQSDWARAPQIRMKAFLHVFMNGPWPYDQATTANYGYAPSTDSEKPHLFVPGALGFLVKRLQNLLSRTEQFDVVAAVPGQQTSASLSSLEGVMGSLLASMSNPAMQLTRTLKLKLVAEEPDNVPRTFANYTVAIHAIATFRALEEYLKGRVGGIDFGAPRNSSEDASGAGMASSSAAATTTSNQNGNAAGEASADDVAIKAEPKEERDGDEDVDMGGEGEDEDGESEGDEDAEEANDDDEGGEGEDVDGDHGYDEGEDYDDDQEIIDVSDILLQSEEQSRRTRSKPKRSDSTGSALSATGELSQGDTPSALERQRTGDSFVVDIGDKEDQGPLTPQRTLRSRTAQGTSAGGTSADGAEPSASGSAAKKSVDARTGLPPPSPLSRPSISTGSSSRTGAEKNSAATSAEKAPAPAAPAPSGSGSGSVSYSSVVAGTSNAFHMEFSVGEPVAGVYIPVTGDSTIFAACWKLEQELARRRSSADIVPSQVNVWNTAYTVKFRKVPGSRPSPSASSPAQVRSSTVAKPASPQTPSTGTSIDHLLLPNLPFETAALPSIDSQSAAGQILYLLRALYGLNTNWADVYLDDNFKVMELTHAKELLDSQPLDEEAMVIENEELAQTQLEPVPARTDLELHPGVIASLPASAFVNSKVTAKLARQLDEPLIVAGHVVPDWCAAVARHFSFLVSFEARWTFLQSTSFGYSRSMLRWQQQQQQQTGGAASREQQVLGRIQRQKVRISRNRMLESMIKVMELYGSSQALLEVEFFEEVGTGLGPTLEFYTLVCTEIQKAKLKMWRDESTEYEPQRASKRSKSSENERYVLAPHGLFPAPMSAASAASENGKKLLNLFRNLGTMVAKSLLDSRMVDIPFNTVFLRQVLKGGFSMAADPADGESEKTAEQQRIRGLHYLKHTDPALTQSLLHLQKYVHQKRVIESRGDLSSEEMLEQIRNVKVDGATIEDLCLDFSLPGYPDFELVPNGKNVTVTIFNVEDYLKAVIEATIGDGVRRQVEAFKAGFDVVFPVTDLCAFTLEELGMLLGGGQQEDWSVEALMEAVKADHGFRMDSVTIRNLLEIMSEFTSLERREFLQFVTGSPKLPLGGFRNLSPALTVVCKTPDGNHKPDHYLPSVMTCVNYLKMPDYSSKEVMKAKLLLAMSEGKGAFHLS